MNKIIIAAVAAVAAIGSTGIASAQQAPQLIGNYSASVLDAHNGVETRNDRVEIDFTSTAAIAPRTVDEGAAKAPVFNWSDESYSR